MPQVEPAFQVAQSADLLRRDVGGNRFQTARGAQQVALGIQDPPQAGAIQHVVGMDRAGNDPGGLLRGQPAQHLHQHFQLALGQPRFDLAHAAALRLLKGVAHDVREFRFIRPTDVVGNRQAAGFGRQGHGVDQHQRPEARIGRKIQVAEIADHLRVFAVRAEIFEQIDRPISRLLDIPQRRQDLAGIDQRLRRIGRNGKHAFGDRPFRQGQFGLLRDVSHQTDGPGLVRRFHGDDGVAGLDQEFQAFGIQGHDVAPFQRLVCEPGVVSRDGRYLSWLIPAICRERPRCRSAVERAIGTPQRTFPTVTCHNDKLQIGVRHHARCRAAANVPAAIASRRTSGRGTLPPLSS